MPKNLILLSDGTGNSAKVFNKSNVWRLYKALDLKNENQIAFYDDGVGTSSLRLLKIIGGVFGWGLSRNVRTLYEFLCRNYETGDRIYLFGFSRGAFTVRLLAHFIVTCGILDHGKSIPCSDRLVHSGKDIPMSHDAGLKLGVKRAYKSYRLGYWLNASWFLRTISRPYRLLRDILVSRVLPPASFKKAYSRDTAGDAETSVITFIGVWDTVDAIGLPIDELTTFLDWCIYPHRFLDQDLSGQIGSACQALAVDDERQTFHPLLWNEKDGIEENRISQVWFSGMHSDVGGDYADNDLSFVSLKWMIDQVEDRTGEGGLQFCKDALAEIACRGNGLSLLHNSRSGALIYYRYRPRHIDDTCWNTRFHVYVRTPKIHHTVFDRIKNFTIGYSPIVLPEDYRVVYSNGDVKDADSAGFENREQRSERAVFHNRARNYVAWRKVTYFALLGVTAWAFLLPFFSPAIDGANVKFEYVAPSLSGWLPDFLAAALKSGMEFIAAFYAVAYNWLNQFVPEITHRWFSAWAHSPQLTTLIILAFLVLYRWNRRVRQRIVWLAEAGWRPLKKLNPEHQYDGEAKRFERVTERLRGNRILQSIYNVLGRWVFPFVFFLAAASVIAGFVYRVTIHNPDVAHGVCSNENAIQSDAHRSADTLSTDSRKGVKTFIVDLKTPCYKSGLFVNSGQNYEILIKGNYPWQDLNIKADLDGFISTARQFHPVSLLGIPARRHLTLPWFVLIAEIGRDSGHIFPMNRRFFSVRPKFSGELYFYVNDGINTLPIDVPFNQTGSITFDTWDAFYRNNSGTAEITVCDPDLTKHCQEKYAELRRKEEGP